MSINLKVYDNGDHTCLVWLPSDKKPIANCRGFAIRRLLNGDESFLHGVVGFSEDDKLNQAAPWKFPLQRFMWWDYFVKPGDKVQYSVIPVTGPNKDKLALDKKNATALTPEMEITGQCTPHISAYFNKGIVAAQWVTKAFGGTPKSANVKTTVATKGNKIRNALSGLLRPQILKLLDEARKQKGQIFAALYELNDVELIDGLVALGKNCNLVLANGAFKSNAAGENDENAAVRASLKGKINVFDRIVTSGHFAHNKFVVFCDAAGKAQKVLTGSTNWTSSGLCTQANNGLIIDDAAIAGDFLAAWHRIKDAGNGYPPAFVNGNSTAQTRQVDGTNITPWFVKTSAAQDLVHARRLINGAKEGILFLFFNPGTFQEDPTRWTLLQNILARHNEASGAAFNADLYFCGVVNQDIPQLTKPAAEKGDKEEASVHDPTVSVAAPVTLFKNGIEPPQRLTHDVLVPHAIKSKFHNWDAELLGASMVNIHSKVIVIDPFGAHPVVMTGSHNLGFKASSANDDNLVIIEGNAPLAAAYAINIVAIFQNYRWNSYVEAHRQDPKAWHGLVDNDTWQNGYLKGFNMQELEFWIADQAAAPAHATTAAAAGSAPPAAAAPPVHHRIHTVAAATAATKKTPAKKKAVPKKK